MNIFNETPENLGIKPVWIQNFLKRLENQDLPIHSAIIMRHKKMCFESYYAPYTKDSLHRMFSITKSFVSVAIGLLEAEGKLSLDQRIVDFFPEKQPEGGPYPYTAMLTIRQMLAMTTCHNSTTYKFSDCPDWVGSFFTVEPTHVPGTNFSYDTSSTHVLGALVEKLTGMELLDYLRSKCLDEIGFSKESYILKDPNGVSMGGSGLCATSRDILKMLMLIAYDGRYYEDVKNAPDSYKQLLPEDYIKSAKLMHSDPYGKQGTLEELQGYGYQIWMTRNNGIVLFGMGGQLALYVPDKDIIMITTADAQGRQGGVQLIYDSFWEEIYNKIDSETIMADSDFTDEDLQEFAKSRELLYMKGRYDSPIIPTVNDVTYICDENPGGVTDISLHIDRDNDSGSVNFTNNTGSHTIDFGLGCNKCGIFPDYNLKYAASASFRLDSTLLIKVHIIDYAVGSMFISINYKDEYVTVMFRKIEENLLNEYNCVFSGHR